jgi:hypothetical protein
VLPCTAAACPASTAQPKHHACTCALRGWVTSTVLLQPRRLSCGCAALYSSCVPLPPMQQTLLAYACGLISCPAAVLPFFRNLHAPACTVHATHAACICCSNKPTQTPCQQAALLQPHRLSCDCAASYSSCVPLPAPPTHNTHCLHMLFMTARSDKLFHCSLTGCPAAVLPCTAAACPANTAQP